LPVSEPGLDADTHDLAQTVAGRSGSPSSPCPLRGTVR